MSTRFCTSCGQSLPENVAFCGSCGHKNEGLNETPTGADVTASTPVEGTVAASPSQVTDGFAWTLAVLPIILVLVNAVLLASYSPGWVSYAISFALGSGLVIADSKRLEARGYKLNMWLGFFLIPVYLYNRSRMLKQGQAMLITWSVLFVLSLFA